MTREELIEAIRAQEPLFRQRRVKHVSLFGSRARGDHRPDSDVDLLVEYEPGVTSTLDNYVGLPLDLTDALGFEVHVLKAPVKRERLRQAVEREAVLVF